MEDEDVIKMLLEHGADVNAPKGHYHGNSLQGAVEKRNRKLVDLLLSNGADINAPEGEFGGALHVSVSKGDEEMTRYLLENGADPKKYADIPEHQVGASLVCIAAR